MPFSKFNIQMKDIENSRGTQNLFNIYFYLNAIISNAAVKDSCLLTYVCFSMSQLAKNLFSF